MPKQFEFLPPAPVTKVVVGYYTQIPGTEIFTEDVTDDASESEGEIENILLSASTPGTLQILLVRKGDHVDAK